MGKMEEESRRRTKKNELKKIVLESVKFAGVLSIALVAPNALGAMAKLGIISTSRSVSYANTCRNRLLKQGLLVRNNKGLLRLTAKGERELRMLQLAEFGERHPRRWDKKWRVLIFDIPEYRKKDRDKIRRLLGSMGFERLQDSVWVYPHDCEDLIVLLKADLHIGKDLLYMIVDSIESDRHLRAIFDLPMD